MHQAWATHSCLTLSSTRTQSCSGLSPCLSTPGFPWYLFCSAFSHFLLQTLPSFHLVFFPHHIPCPVNGSSRSRCCYQMCFSAASLRILPHNDHQFTVNQHICGKPSLSSCTCEEELSVVFSVHCKHCLAVRTYHTLVGVRRTGGVHHLWYIGSGLQFVRISLKWVFKQDKNSTS